MCLPLTIALSEILLGLPSLKKYDYHDDIHDDDDEDDYDDDDNNEDGACH